MRHWVSTVLAVIAALGVGAILKDWLTRRWSKRDKESNDRALVEIAEISSAEKMNAALWEQLGKQREQQERTENHVREVQEEVFTARKDHADALRRIVSLETSEAMCKDELQEMREKMERIHFRSAPDAPAQ